MPVKSLFGSKEMHTDRQDYKCFPLLCQFLLKGCQSETLCIFLRSKDEVIMLRPEKYLFYICPAKSMVIRVSHHIRMSVQSPDMLHQVLGLGYSAYHEGIAGMRNSVIFDACKMQTLIGRQMQSVIYNPHVYRPNVIRTFGNHNIIRLECP